MQSGWKMWRHGSSRTCVLLASKSSRQMGQVGWFSVGVGASGAEGAEAWRTSGVSLIPDSGSTAGVTMAARGGACGVFFSGSFVE
jgi:hypothetical protein